MIGPTHRNMRKTKVTSIMEFTVTLIKATSIIDNVTGIPDVTSLPGFPRYYINNLIQFMSSY